MYLPWHGVKVLPTAKMRTCAILGLRTLKCAPPPYVVPVCLYCPCRTCSVLSCSLIPTQDRNGRREGEAEFDSTTLLIPPAAFNRFTPFERQYWTIKQVGPTQVPNTHVQNCWDTVLFFKKGKFYELYERDAGNSLSHSLPACFSFSRFPRSKCS